MNASSNARALCNYLLPVKIRRAKGIRTAMMTSVTINGSIQIKKKPSRRMTASIKIAPIAAAKKMIPNGPSLVT